MARKMTEWPSKRGPITKIMPSDGCIGDTVPLAVGKWYDFHEFGWYMGNDGGERYRNLGSSTPVHLNSMIVRSDLVSGVESHIQKYLTLVSIAKKLEPQSSGHWIEQNLMNKDLHSAVNALRKWQPLIEAAILRSCPYRL